MFRHIGFWHCQKSFFDGGSTNQNALTKLLGDAEEALLDKTMSERVDLHVQGFRVINIKAFRRRFFARRTKSSCKKCFCCWRQRGKNRRGTCSSIGSSERRNTVIALEETRCALLTADVDGRERPSRSGRGRGRSHLRRRLRRRLRRSRSRKTVTGRGGVAHC